jgi:hypothetical protein
MSTLGMAQVPTDLDTPDRGDARAWQLLKEVLDGKLDVQTLCERHQMPLDEAQGWLRERHRSALMAFDAQLKRALIRQGASPEALVGPELSVSLDDVNLLDWIQAIQIFAKEAVISVLHEEGESRIWCSQGGVIDASSGRLRGEAAFYRIAALEHGRVVTELRPVQRERTIRISPTSLLLEAARRKDERALLERKLGGLDRYYHSPAQPVLTRSLNTAQAAMLQLFDQPRQLADVVAESDLGDIETLAALDGLLRSGQLVEAPVSRIEARPRSGPRSELARGADSPPAPIAFAWPHAAAPRSNHWRWAATTLVTGLLVAGAAWLGTQASIAKATARVAAEPAAPAPPVVYSVVVRTEPVEAELQVDGQVVGRGAWKAAFTRDGVAHELRVSAGGFLPMRVIFADTPPPPVVRLERLPNVPTPVAPLVEPTALVGETGSDSEEPRRLSPDVEEMPNAGPGAGARAPAAEAVAKRRASLQRRERLSRPSGAKAGSPVSATAPAAAKKRPFVQIIDADEPQPQPD